MVPMPYGIGNFRNKKIEGHKFDMCLYYSFPALLILVVE